MRLNPRIFGAFLVGAGLIACAYFSEPTIPTQTESTDGVIVGVAPARTYIEVGDSNENGIPDWTEELLQAEPIVVTMDASSTEAYTPPDTLTSKIALDIFTSTVRSDMLGPLGPTPDSIIKTISADISKNQDTFTYTEADLTISNNVSESSLRVYSNQIAGLVVREVLPEGTRAEIEILEDALQQNNPEILTELDPIISAYERTRDDMLLITVPENMVVEHLELLNSYNGMLHGVEAMREAFDDPMYAMLSIQQYYTNMEKIHTDLTQLFRSVHIAGVRWSENDMSSQIVTIE